jgi:hypothetical protein
MHSVGPRTHVLGRLVTFRYCTKVDSKLAELVPLMLKFAKQSRVGICRNKLVALTHKFAKQSHVRIFRNECT